MAVTIHPLAKVALLSVANQRPANFPRLLIFHTNAGGSSSTGVNTRSWIERELAAGRSPTQPHHQVDLDGTIWQFLPYDRKGVASYKAEGFCISVETQDYGYLHSSIEQQPWTDRQIEALAIIAVFVYRQYDIPLRRPTGPYERGIGTHSMWGYNTTANMDINPWTSVKGKTCPGAARKDQLDRILARAAQIVDVPAPLPPPTPPPSPPPPAPVPVKGDTVQFVISANGGSTVYITDWITKRRLNQETYDLFRLISPDPANGVRMEAGPDGPKFYELAPAIVTVIPEGVPVVLAGPSAAEIANELARRLVS